MCKLFCIIDIENEDNAMEFAQKAVKPLTAKDNDGLGVILMGDKGLGVERWLKPSDFPDTQETLSPTLAKYASLIPVRYNSIGAITQQNIYAIGIHSRMATSAKTLENVHPFVKNGLALIHNGVISNHERWEKELSSCDSEALLTLYQEHQVTKHLKNVQKIEDETTGWYAFMVFNELKKTVDIVKDATTPLFFAHIPTVGMVFCTSDEIIKSCTGQMKLRQSTIYPFPDRLAIRWTYGKKGIDSVEITQSFYTPPAVSTAGDDSSKCRHGVYPKRWCKTCQWDKEDKDFKEISVCG